jgi:hypothetical protein
VTAAARDVAGGRGDPGLVARRDARRGCPAVEAGAADAHLANEAVRDLEPAMWRGRWTKRQRMRDGAGVGRLQRYVSELHGYVGATRTRWRTTLPCADEVSRFRRISWMVRSTRSSPAHEQAAADALEQDDRAILPRSTNCRVERQSRGRLPPSPSRLLGDRRQSGSVSGRLTIPKLSHALVFTGSGSISVQIRLTKRHHPGVA